MSTVSPQLTSIDRDALAHTCGGAGPKQPMSLDITNGLGEYLWADAGGRVPTTTINGTKIPRETHELVGKVLSKGKR